jgi:hypothetical protein
MKLYPFADDGRETALRLLIDGFPLRPPQFWTRGLDRVLAHARRFSPGRAGWGKDCELDRRRPTLIRKQRPAQRILTVAGVVNVNDVGNSGYDISVW